MEDVRVKQTREEEVFKTMSRVLSLREGDRRRVENQRKLGEDLFVRDGNN